MKKILSIIMLCIICSLSLVVMASAAMPENQIEPLYENLSSATLDIGYYDGTTGLVTATATRKAGTTKMVGVVDVYQWINNDWEFVTSFAKESTRNSLVISEEFSAQQGQQYKAIFTISAIDATLTEVDVLECVKTYN